MSAGLTNDVLINTVLGCVVYVYVCVCDVFFIACLFAGSVVQVAKKN